MDSLNKQSLAWARFSALRSHLPLYWDESSVQQFHGVVTDLEEAYELDLSSFRIPDTEMKTTRHLCAARALFSTLSRPRSDVGQAILRPTFCPPAD
jgi:hypothetical protein